MSLLDVTSVFSSWTHCLCTAGANGGLGRNQLPGAGASQSAEAGLAACLASEDCLMRPGSEALQAGSGQGKSECSSPRPDLPREAGSHQLSGSLSLEHFLPWKVL